MVKVALISQQGSGTNLLRSFLNDHDDITFLSELFINESKAHAFKDAYVHYKGLTKSEFLSKTFDKYKNKVVGFDLKYNQMDNEILNYLIHNDFYIIQLIRDPVRTFFKNNEPKGFTVNDVRKYCNDVWDKILFLRGKFKALKKFSYERYEADWKRILQEVTGKKL